MSLFSKFWTRPKVQNRSKWHFAKFLPFAGLCNFVNALVLISKSPVLIPYLSFAISGPYRSITYWRIAISL
jgi:hypothetical protein